VIAVWLLAGVIAYAAVFLTALAYVLLTEPTQEAT
jgi:hypothetical protein